MADKKEHHEKPNPPLPEEHPGRGALPFSLFSILVSLLFIIYGSYLLIAINSSVLLMAFAVLSIFYGLSGLLILVCAYKLRAPGCITAIMISAVSFLVVYIIALSSGVLIGLQLSGFFLLAFALWCNWLAVVKVVKGGGNHRLQ